MINYNQSLTGGIYPYNNLISPYISFDVLSSPGNAGHVHGTDLAVLPDKYMLRVNLAGYPKESIKVKTVGKKLVISAKGEDIFGSDIKVMSREIPYGDFGRIYDLSSVEVDKITAKYDMGILSISIPRMGEGSEMTEREIDFEG